MDEKEKGLNTELFNEEPCNDSPKAETTPEDETMQQIHDEMENLAVVFQKELDKAKKDAENGVSESTSAEGSDAEEVEEPEALKEEELCACCGENRRGTKENPDSIYCEDCEAGLRRYPFDFLNIFFVVAVLVLVCYGGYLFAGHTEAYAPVLEADKLVQEDKLFSAIDKYSVAANAMLNNHIHGELVYKRELLAVYELGGMNMIPGTAQKIKAFEFKLPHFAKLRKAVDNAESYMVTSVACNELVMPYESKKPQEVPYEDLIAKLEALKSATPPPMEDPTMSEENPKGYQPAPPVYKPAMIAFYKYYVALLTEQPVETQLQFVEEIRTAAPEEVWLYGSLLGDLYAKSGKDVEPVCDLLFSLNREDDTPDLLRVESLRIQGNPEDALLLAEKQVQADSTLSVEFLRQQALCHLALNDFESAFKKADAAMEKSLDGGSPSIQVCNTLALCALTSKNDEAYQEVEKMLKSNDISLSDEVLAYKDGKLLLQNILSEGDYDL